MYLLPLLSSSQNRRGAAPNLEVSACRKSLVETSSLLGTMLASFSAPCNMQIHTLYKASAEACGWASIIAGVDWCRH